jgi:hypothetical protein
MQSIFLYPTTFSFAILFLLQTNNALSQGREGDGTGLWLQLQAVPSLSWTVFPEGTHFALEWEAAPILYSFGMSKLDRRFHFFSVTQPERFAGSVEFNISFQFYTTKYRNRRTGSSVQILSHLPLIEKGEHLGLNLGLARYYAGGTNYDYIITGLSTLFGLVHYNIKFSPEKDIWMHSVEFRFF